MSQYREGIVLEPAPEDKKKLWLKEILPLQEPVQFIINSISFTLRCIYLVQRQY